VNQQASGPAKIDPLITAFNAIALMSMNPWSSRPSIFVI
jgi:phage terminase large subunit-like protein